LSSDERGHILEKGGILFPVSTIFFFEYEKFGFAMTWRFPEMSGSILRARWTAWISTPPR
jgi:hypothetical protein